MTVTVDYTQVDPLEDGGDFSTEVRNQFQNAQNDLGNRPESGETNSIGGAWTFTNIRIDSSAAVPADTFSTGVKGEVRFDNNYLYICVSTNLWRRIALSGWI